MLHQIFFDNELLICNFNRWFKVLRKMTSIQANEDYDFKVLYRNCSKEVEKQLNCKVLGKYLHNIVIIS